MSQLILDEQLNLGKLLPAIQGWITAQSVHDLRPEERILDDRIPEILRTLRQPTFVTIDQDLWDRGLCHPGYAILYFFLRDDQQVLLPGLLRALFRRPEFRTRGSRMGKVARISPTMIDYWQFRARTVQSIPWQGASRRRR